MRGLLAEGIRMKGSGSLTGGQVGMGGHAPKVTRATNGDRHPEVGILPTGQGVGSIHELPSCADLIGRTVAEAGVALDRLCSPRE